MNSEWSELNKKMQNELKKKETFSEGIKTLFELRSSLMACIKDFKKLSSEQMSAMPFMNAKGYHSKNIAYSLFHIFRIEDIVAHTIISRDEQVFFTGDFQKKMNSSVITTGNELVKQEIGDFSAALNLKELFAYISEVDKSTTKLIKKLSFEDCKRKFCEEDKEAVRKTGTVSEKEEAVWLIDYWCGKDLRGLIQMPFSRHWIMHIEASLRILEKIKK